MKARSFTTKIDVVHQRWAEEKLGLEPQGGGIDLLANGFGFELKSRLVPGESSAFPLHYYQVDDFPAAHPEKRLYWMLIYYTMSKKVKQVRNKDLEDSNLVTWRDIHFVPWDYVRQFKVWKPKTGPYLYFHKHEIPEAKIIKKIKGAKLYLPDKHLEELL